MKPSFIHLKPEELKGDYAAGRKLQTAVLSRLPLSGNRKALEAMRDDRALGKAKPISEMGVRERLRNLANRAIGICGEGLRKEAKEFFDAVFAGLDDQDSRKKVSDMVAASQGGDNEAQATLSLMVAENVGKLIRFTGSYMQWYKTVTLGEADVPYIRTYVPQEINVRLGTADGTTRVHNAMPDLEDDTKAILFFMVSDMLRAKLFDENKGMISDAALGTVDIALDLADKIDAYLQLACLPGTPNSIFVANFVNNGTPASHYHASARINTGNYPAGNIIAPTTNGANTLPRYDCLFAIDDYFSRLASLLDGAVGPVRVHVPSIFASAFGKEFTPTSVANVYADQVARNNKLLNVNGRNFEIIPDDTLSPTSKYLLVNAGLPVGLFFNKPAGSKVFRKEDDILNEVVTWERALISTLYPVPWAVGSLAIQFKT